jgi:hypothetical protein
MDESRSGLVRPLALAAKLRVRLLLWLALLLALPCGGQNSTDGGQGSMHPFHGSEGMDQIAADDALDPTLEEKRLRMIIAAQHKSMVADTDKLLRLVTELNAEINGMNPSSLTPEQLRKVAEIEKLARSVKDKMRMSAQVAPGFQDSMPLSIPPNLH